MKGVKTLAQKAGLKTDVQIEKEIQKVIAEPTKKAKIVKQEAVSVVSEPPKAAIKKVKKVLMDEDGNILKMERKKRELTDEQREVLRERLAKAREVRAAKRVQ